LLNHVFEDLRKPKALNTVDFTFLLYVFALKLRIFWLFSAATIFDGSGGLPTKITYFWQLALGR
jgi:hypothetical protein